MSGKIVHQEIYVAAPGGNMVKMKLEMRHDGVSIFIPAPNCENEESIQVLENISRDLKSKGIIHEAMQHHGRVDRVSFKTKYL